MGKNDKSEVVCDPLKKTSKSLNGVFKNACPSGIKPTGSMEKPEHIWFLLSRNLSGEASTQEKEALMQALQQQPGLMQQYELLQRLWKPQQSASPEEITARVSQILQRSALESVEQASPVEQEYNEQPVSRLRFLKPVRWAAAVAGIILAVYTWQQYHPVPSTTGNEIVAKKGSKTRTLLPDGSTVWLNAGSSITYDPVFAGNTREVTLQGEAFFDIVKQPDKPFIVHAGDLNIRVLGTAFNVKSYAEEPTIETTLIRGLIQITRPADSAGAPIYLHPHQKIVLARAEHGSAPAPVIAATQSDVVKPEDAIVNLDSSLKENERFETAWLYNRLEFRGERFEDLAKKLERWYNITIHFEDEPVRQLVWTGSLEIETTEQAFRALTEALPFHYEIKGNDIYIRSGDPAK